MFYGSIRFHTSQPVGYSHNPEDTALFQDNGKALTANSEAYIGWNGRDRVLKLGNLMLNTPMMNDDSTRIVPWSYQGMAYTGKATPNTKVQLYHISQIRSHTSDTYTNTRTNDSRGDDFDAYYFHWRHRFRIDSSLYVRYENLEYKNDKVMQII